MTSHTRNDVSDFDDIKQMTSVSRIYDVTCRKRGQWRWWRKI